MSETTAATPPTLPPLYLPPEATRHLRALIYASTPGHLITNLSQHESATQIALSLSQTPPLTPLYHSPHPNIPHNKNFLSIFPLTACYTPPSQEIVLHTTLPDILHTLSEELPLPQGVLADTSTSVLLKTGTLRVSHGFVVLDSGCYNPLMELPRGNCGEIVGAWGRDDVSVTAALLRLARYLYRRCNRRLRTDGNRAVKKEVVLLGFREDGVTVRRGWIAVSGVRRWVCYLPLRGGVAHFVPVGTGGRREVLNLLRDVAGDSRNVNRAVERDVESAVRGGRRYGEVRRRRRRSGTVGDVRRDDREQRPGPEDELMVWKMREFNFGERDGGDVGDQRGERAQVDDEGESVVEVQNTDEGDETGTSEVRVADVDIDALGNTTTSTTTTSSSSDSEREEEMMETLCRQYLNQGYLESVEHELKR